MQESDPEAQKLFIRTRRGKHILAHLSGVKGIRGSPKKKSEKLNVEEESELKIVSCDVDGVRLAHRFLVGYSREKTENVHLHGPSGALSGQLLGTCPVVLGTFSCCVSKCWGLFRSCWGLSGGFPKTAKTYTRRGSGNHFEERPRKPPRP